MNANSDRRAVQGPRKTQESVRSTQSKRRTTEWELADDQLDDALRQTFPASDALSVVQNVRRT